MSTVLNFAFDNAPPVRSLSRLAFSPGGALEAAVFADVGGHSAYTFTTPFAGRLLSRYVGGVRLEADIDQDQAVVAALWPTLMTAGGNPGVIPAGVQITVRFFNDDTFAGDPVADHVDFEEEPSAAGSPNVLALAATVADATHDNTAPGIASLTGVTHDNTVPEASAEPLQQSPAALTNVAPVQMVIPGEVAPVVSGTPPTPMTLAAHNTTLLAGVNYTVQVGSRSAPVTVTLPAAPASGQRIEVVDTSGQGALHPITVDAGAVDIETAGTKTYLVNRNDAVLALYYTGTKWKLL